LTFNTSDKSARDSFFAFTSQVVMLRDLRFPLGHHARKRWLPVGRTWILRVRLSLVNSGNCRVPTACKTPACVGVPRVGLKLINGRRDEGNSVERR